MAYIFAVSNKIAKYEVFIKWILMKKCHRKRCLYGQFDSLNFGQNMKSETKVQNPVV